LLEAHRDDFTKEYFQEIDESLSDNIKRHISE
jgi:hypothetical protein